MHISLRQRSVSVSSLTDGMRSETTRLGGSNPNPAQQVIERKGSRATTSMNGTRTPALGAYQKTYKNEIDACAATIGIKC